MKQKRNHLLFAKNVVLMDAILDAARPNCPSAKLIEIAAWVGFELNREEVYVITWVGRIEFVKPADWSK